MTEIQMTEIQLVKAWFVVTARRLQRRDRNGAIQERGADIVQTVIIVGLFAAAAIIIIGILVSKATDAANNVKTQ